MMNWW